MTIPASTDTTSSSTQAAAQPAHGAGISRDTLIAERNRGKQMGQRQLLRELGVSSLDDLKARLAPASKSNAQSAPAFDLSDLEDLIGRAVEQRLSPIAQDVAAQKQAREAAAKLAEDQTKAQREAAEREAAEAQAAAEAEKAYKAEVAKLREIAEEVGAKVSDKSAFDRLLQRVQVELNALEDEEFDSMFGEGATPKQYEANVKQMLAGIRRAHPSLFEAEKSAPADKPTAAAHNAEAKETVQAATTSKPVGGAAASAASATAAAAKRQLDVRKLSPKQFAEYNRNRDAFRRQFEQGLIDYDAKK